MAKFRRGDLVRLLECDNPAFLGFEGAVTRVHEANGGEFRALPDGDGGLGRDTGVAHYDVQIDMLNAPAGFLRMIWSWLEGCGREWMGVMKGVLIRMAFSVLGFGGGIGERGGSSNDNPYEAPTGSSVKVFN